MYQPLFHPLSLSPPLSLLLVTLYYIYADDRGRVTWDSEETRVLRAIKKKPYQSFDIGSNLAYDFRVSLAV